MINTLLRNINEYLVQLIASKMYFGSEIYIITMNDNFWTRTMYCIFAIVVLYLGSKILKNFVEKDV